METSRPCSCQCLGCLFVHPPKQSREPNLYESLVLFADRTILLCSASVRHHLMSMLNSCPGDHLRQHASLRYWVTARLEWRGPNLESPPSDLTGLWRLTYSVFSFTRLVIHRLIFHWRCLLFPASSLCYLWPYVSLHCIL